MDDESRIRESNIRHIERIKSNYRPNKHKSCPECKSNNIRKKHKVIGIGFYFKCKDCGYCF